MRQRFMDRIGVEYEPPLIGGEAEGYEGAGGDLSVEAPTSDPQHVHVDTDAEDRESGKDGFYVPSLDDVDEARDGDGAGSSPSDGKTGPESTEEIAEEELAEKSVESSPDPRPESDLVADDADEMLSRETRKAELHEDISTARPRRIACRRVPMRITATSQPPCRRTGRARYRGLRWDGIRDAAEDRDGDGTPDSHDQDAEYIDDDPLTTSPSA